MSKKITSQESDNMSIALGISEKRYKEITNTMAAIMEKHQEIRYSEIAEQTNSRLDLTPNETFLIGYLLGGLSQFQFLVNGVIQEMEDVSDLPKDVPLVKSQRAMA